MVVNNFLLLIYMRWEFIKRNPCQVYKFYKTDSYGIFFGVMGFENCLIRQFFGIDCTGWQSLVCAI